MRLHCIVHSNTHEDVSEGVSVSVCNLFNAIMRADSTCSRPSLRLLLSRNDGVAVVWPTSRCYRQMNLTASVVRTTDEP